MEKQLQSIIGELRNKVYIYNILRERETHKSIPNTLSFLPQLNSSSSSQDYKQISDHVGILKHAAQLEGKFSDTTMISDFLKYLKESLSEKIQQIMVC